MDHKLFAVIYLDHNATTPILPEVLDAMMPYLTTEWGNPSSSYKFGSKLKSVVETAREQVAELIGAPSRDVIFTSCATESNNTAIAAALKAIPTKRHIVTSQVEHSSVLNYCKALQRGDFTPPPVARVSPPASENEIAGRDTRATNSVTPGYRVTYLPVDREDLLNLADLEAAIMGDTAVVSLMR